MSLSRVALLCLCDPSQTVEAYRCPIDPVFDLQDDKCRRYDNRSSRPCPRAIDTMPLLVSYLVVW